MKLAGGAARGTHALDATCGVRATRPSHGAARARFAPAQLYSNTKPDPNGVPRPLDGFPAVKGVPFGARLDALVDALVGRALRQADPRRRPRFRRLGPRGEARPPTTATSWTPTRPPFAGFSSRTSRRETEVPRSRAERLRPPGAAFYDPRARAYRSTAGDTSSTLTFTPLRFALLQASLRDTYELIGLLPGRTALATLVETASARLNKLVLNGWDDRDQDEQIEWPEECAHRARRRLPPRRPADGRAGALRRVGLGDGHVRRGPTLDGRRPRARLRPEISAVGLPAALAGSVTFSIEPVRGAVMQRALVLALAATFGSGGCSSAPPSSTSHQTTRRASRWRRTAPPSSSSTRTPTAWHPRPGFAQARARGRRCRPLPERGCRRGRFDSSVLPRALALDPGGRDSVRHRRAVGSPLRHRHARAADLARALVLGADRSARGADDSRVFVACSQDDTVVELDAFSLSPSRRRVTPPQAVGARLGPGRTHPRRDAPAGPWREHARADPPRARGHVAGWVPDVGDREAIRRSRTAPCGASTTCSAARAPASSGWCTSCWGPTRRNRTLVFDNTVFPSVSILDPAGRQLARLSVQGASDTPGADGAFGDIVSGPRTSRSPTTARWPSSSTRTAKTCSSSTPRSVSRRRSFGRCRATCPRAPSGTAATSTSRSATRETSWRSRS